MTKSANNCQVPMGLRSVHHSENLIAPITRWKLIHVANFRLGVVRQFSLGRSTQAKKKNNRRNTGLRLRAQELITQEERTEKKKRLGCVFRSGFSQTEVLLDGNN